MPFDRFMIAPLTSGLETNFHFLKNASSGILLEYTKECMNKKIYKSRVDIIDLTGQVFADLTVIEYSGKGKYRGAVWNCKCSCGNYCIVPGGHLRAGMRKSCGCRSQSRINATGVNRIYSLYKKRSNKKSIFFNLPKEHFELLIKGNCHYCGSSPSQILKRLKTDKIQILYNGIDRVVPVKGYILENCVSCCRYCNVSKSDLSVDQWKDHIKRISRWLSIDL